MLPMSGSREKGRRVTCVLVVGRKGDVLPVSWSREKGRCVTHVW